MSIARIDTISVRRESCQRPRNVFFHDAPDMRVGSTTRRNLKNFRSLSQRSWEYETQRDHVLQTFGFLCSNRIAQQLWRGKSDSHSTSPSRALYTGFTYSSYSRPITSLAMCHSFSCSLRPVTWTDSSPKGFSAIQSQRSKNVSLFSSSDLVGANFVLKRLSEWLNSSSRYFRPGYKLGSRYSGFPKGSLQPMYYSSSIEMLSRSSCHNSNTKRVFLTRSKSALPFSFASVSATNATTLPA